MIKRTQERSCATGVDGVGTTGNMRSGSKASVLERVRGRAAYRWEGMGVNE